MRDKLKICLVASGGGHLRQALDIAPAWGLGEVTVISEGFDPCSVNARQNRMPLCYAGDSWSGP